MHTARRAFAAVPVLVFLMTLVLFASTGVSSASDFAQALLRASAASLTSSLLCIAGYGFYGYTVDRTHGL
jgi:VIT1/CCC1 family predicted Fe2+/Mn2+ transporter